MLVLEDLDKPLEASAQEHDLRDRRPLLGAEHLGGVHESGPHVACHDQLDPAQSAQGVQGPQRGQTTVGRCGPAHADDDP